MKTLCLCAVLLVVSNVDSLESRLVNTVQGPVKGYQDPQYGYYVFKGIPYATAPTGLDKFKAPLPPPKWVQPLEAVDKRIICPQIDIQFLPNDRIKQEDCLIVNLLVPATIEKNLSVLIYVHGGVFQIGYGGWHIPKELIIENNIIFVTFNYRLGPHGFLSLGTESIPGNAGMKDQVAALRWVKENIASFSGNPYDITLYGSSSGSASVDLLLLSKSAEGLFNKAILESGANIAAWAIQPDPLENAKLLAKTLNFTNLHDVSALEHFFKTIPLDKLASVDFSTRTDSTFVFSPCVERSSGEVFLDKSPVEILKSGNYSKVPLLNGITNMEGKFRLRNIDSWKSKMNVKFSDFLPADLKFESKEQKEEIANQIKQFYFGDEPVGNNNILKYIEYFTDAIFAYPVLRSVKYHVEAGHDRVYLYEYSFVDEETPVVPYTTVKGADHDVQKWAVFNGELGHHNEEFQKMSATMRNLWGAFIKTGKPSVRKEGSPDVAWPSVGADLSPHMSLGNDISLRGPLLESRVRFWDGIYLKHYRHPIPASSA